MTKAHAWKHVEKQRLDGRTYHTVTDGTMVSAHKFLTKKEAEQYADLLNRIKAD